MFRFLLSLSLLLFFVSCIVALNTTSTGDENLDDIFESSAVGESRRRRRNRFPFGHKIWCKLKVKLNFVTLKV